MVSLYGWLTQEKWWSHCMGDLPKKNNGLIVWVTYPRGRILSKLHAFLRNSFNTRSLLATFLDECRSTRSFPAISNNLESHLAIPLPITKYKNTYVVSLWRVTCPNGKREEWSHYYGWPTQGEWWSHCMGDLPKKKDEEWSHCMGDLPRKNDGLIVWVTNPRKMMVSLYGWRTQEK